MSLSRSSEQSVSRTRFSAAICGNPNCGKTTIFNALTGMRQRVGNFPGVTVENVTGEFTYENREESVTVTLQDVPGSYSLAAFSPDEYIAAQALFGSFADRPPDVIVCTIDATNLERGLYLLFQVLEIGRPVVVALNMIDLAQRRGIRIDDQALSRSLGGISVVPMVANRGQGMTRLKREMVLAARQGKGSGRSFYDAEIVDAVSALALATQNGSRSRAEYLRVLFDADGLAERGYLSEDDGKRQNTLLACREKLIEKFGSLSAAETQPLMSRAAELVAGAVARGETRPSRSEQFDKIALHPVFGPLILVILMVLIFQSIFSWAEPLMNLIDGFFGLLANLVEASMTAGPLRSLLTDGVIGGVGSVIMFLPQIAILFFFISVLEDSGYLPRAAFLVDRMFSWCGLSGRSLIPLLTSFACAVPGIMATRTIENRRVRLMTILVAPLMSCSARLPVYTILIAAFIPHAIIFGMFNLQGLVLAALYLIGVSVAVIVAYIMKKSDKRPMVGSFLMELPPYRVPTAQVVGIRVWTRARMFLVRAGTIILAITIIIWALSYYPQSEQRVAAAGLTTQAAGTAQLEELRAGEQLRNSYLGRAGRALEPVFRPLGWDWKITMAALASFPAREVIISTLGTIYNLGRDEDETSVSLIEKLREARWDHGPKIGRPVFTPAVALSIMVFFALCAQCAATLVTIRQETGNWKYSVFTFVYMTSLAYVGGTFVYQIFSRLGW